MKSVVLLGAIVLSFNLQALAQSQGPNTTPASLVEVGADRVVLHKDLPILLRSTQVISSRANKAGDVVGFEIIRPIMAGNLVVIPEGAHVTATVAVADRAGRGGKGGRLKLEFKSVRLVTGQEVPISADAFFDAGRSGPSDATVMMGFAAVLFDSLRRGQDADLPKGLRFIAGTVNDAIVGTADLVASQPAPRAVKSDTGYLYLFMDAMDGPQVACKFMVGEVPYVLLPELAVRVELPPGDYWLRTGRATKDQKIAKAKLADLTLVTVKGGESYYITWAEDPADKHNAFLRTVPAADAVEHIEKSAVLWDYPLAGQTPEKLREFRAQPLKR